MTSTFQHSKLLGDQAEEAVAAAIAERLSAEVLRTTGRASYDLLVQQRVEVKHDLAAIQTGRVCVETGYKGRPSGLAATTAHWWAIVVGDEAFLIRTCDLESLAATCPPITCGDNLDSLCRFVPLSELRAAARLVRLK